MSNGATSKAEIELSKLHVIFERGLDIDGRILYLFGDIDETMAENIIMGLSYLSKSEGPITLMINSQGGSVSDMFAIYDSMLACPNDITTIGIGEVCSAAGLLLVAGDTRLASRNCLFMAHQVSGGYNADESLHTVEAQVAATRMCWDRWAKCMAKHTKHTENYWNRELPSKIAELWLPSEKMMQAQHGIIDAIWE